MKLTESFQRDDNDGLRKLAASAALIRAAMEGYGAFDAGELNSPQLRLRSDGEFEAWINAEDGSGGHELFSAWPNKFGRLAFGFACDHFKMVHQRCWAALSARAAHEPYPLVIWEPERFGIDRSRGLSEARPERMTAPALMALCQRMTSAPNWLLGALDDLEKGLEPQLPKGPAKPKSAP